MSEPIEPIQPVGDDYEVEETPAAKPKRTVRGAAIVGVRVVAGTVGLGVALAAIAGAAFLPIPTLTKAPPSVEVNPVPTAQQLVCPGSLLRLGDETGQAATTSSAIGAAAVRYDSTRGTVTAAPFDQSDAGTGGSSSAPLLISSPAGDGGDEDSDDPLLVSGAQSQAADSAEFGGLAATDCAGVSTETWLVGGATSVGRTTLVTLANPSDTISTVSLGIHSDLGKVSAPGATGIVVQPHGQRVLSLAGFAPDVESPVVQVVSRGGQIVANLQQATVRGLEAGGVDIVGRAATPALTQVIPGIVVAGSADLSARLGEAGFGDLATVVRVFVPGDEGTTAEVSVVNDDGTPTGASFSIELDAGTVQDLPVDGLVDGTYAVTVTTSQPVVASVRVSTVAAPVLDAEGTPSGGPSDFAWLAGVEMLEDSALVTVASGPQPRVHLFNPTDEEAVVTVAEIDGDELTVTVPAQGSAETAVSPGSTYQLDGFDSLYASVSFSGGAQIAGYGVQPPALNAGTITVYP